MLTLVMFAGMMRHSDGTLHYFVDGVDQGPAFEGLPQYVYPVIDLYGQCAQVCNFVKTLLVILYLINMLFKTISYSRFSRQNFFWFSCQLCLKEIQLMDLWLYHV